MNVRVGAGPMICSIVATVVSPTVSTAFKKHFSPSHVEMLTWACSSLTHLSINGTSLNAIEPDFLKVGELTTLAMA